MVVVASIEIKQRLMFLYVSPYVFNQLAFYDLKYVVEVVVRVRACAYSILSEHIIR